MPKNQKSREESPAKPSTAPLVSEVQPSLSPIVALDERRPRRRSASRPAIKELPLAAPSSTPPYEVRVSFKQLRLSQLNYRKTFDLQKLAELKEEILRNGLEHNLVVRPLEDSLFEVLVGSRRTRAIEALVEEQLWNADEENIPVQVRSDVSDVDAIILAMGENNHRHDVLYLEQAEGILHAVHLMTGGERPARGDGVTAKLAERLGLGQRWVQILYGFATKLHPDTKTYLQDLALPPECAKAFATVSPELQAERLPRIAQQEVTSPYHLRRLLLQSLPTSEDAVFDPKLYEGEMTEQNLFQENSDPTTETPECFLDLQQFARLQKEALLPLRDQLLPHYAFVEIGEGTELPIGFEHQFGERDETTGLFLLLGKDLKVRRIECFREAPDQEIVPDLPETEGDDSEDPRPTPSPSPETVTPGPSAAPASTKAEEPLYKAHLYAAHRLKTEALQARIAKRPFVAMRLAIVGLMGLKAPIRIGAESIYRDDCTLAPEMMPSFDKLKATLGELLEDPSTPHGEERVVNPNALMVSPTRLWQEQTPAQLLAILAALPDPVIANLFAFLIAARTGSFCDLNPKYGDAPGVVALAEILGVERAPLHLDEAFLSGYRKPHLLKAATACGLDSQSLEKKTAKQIREAILACKAASGFRPPELAFGTTQAIHEGLINVGTVPAPPPASGPRKGRRKA